MNGRYRWTLAGVALALTIAALTVVSTPARSSAVTRRTEPITAIPAPQPAPPAKIALGEWLFSDQRLSGDGAHSCASCHDLGSNGASRASCDGPMHEHGPCFNTPTLFNAALSFRLGWEGKFRTLESQASASLERAMGIRLDEAVAKLKRDPDMVRQFNTAYGRGPNGHDLIDALATFERSLITPGSRFDRWLSGEEAALSAQELEGYRLFKSLGCISCHQGVNVGGNLFEKQGVFHPLVRAEPDILRVPSLRNIATTAPYFHDGSADSLDEAVKRMANAQLDSKLTAAQVDAIVAWLGTLTGVYRSQAVHENP
jgi:cytochrome c peroxidase